MAKAQNKTWDDAAEGTRIPRIELDFTYSRVVWGAIASMDLFPGHHEKEYAERQGQETIYVNTMVYQGWIDRVVTDWAGPASFVIKRKMTMRRAVYAGSIMYGEGVVTRRYRDAQGRTVVDIDIDVGDADGSCCPAKVTALLDVAPRSL